MREPDIRTTVVGSYPLPSWLCVVPSRAARSGGFSPLNLPREGPVPRKLISYVMLAGLVAITAPCAFVDPWAAAVIGVVAGILVVYSVFFFENSGIDDPVGAISVHGMNGLWGVLALGIFANGQYGAGWNGVVRDEFVKAYGSDGVRGLLYGDASQLFAQLLSCVVVSVFGFAMAYVWFVLSDKITPIRVEDEVEIGGLDGPEMGTVAYPDFPIHKGSHLRE